MEPTRPAVEAKNANHWTTKEIPKHLSVGWSGSFALNAFPHHNFKRLCGKTKCCGNPILYPFSSDLPCERTLFTVCIMHFHLCICVLPPDYELLGWQDLSFFCELTCRTEPDRNDSSPSFSQDPHQADWFTSPFLLFCLLL